MVEEQAEQEARMKAGGKGNMFVWNVDLLSTTYKASCPRR
jgi:hypothetical protein